MPFRFNATSRFDKNFKSFEIGFQERVKKQLVIIKNSTIEELIEKAPELRDELAGVRKWTSRKIRIYMRICKDCRDNHWDVFYDRCRGCEREDDLINLIDVAYRSDDTYDDLNWNGDDAKSFDGIKF